MLDMIPSDVVREILLRLPGKSLLRLRCVCKEWRSVIDDPSFVRSHANIQLSSPTLLILCTYEKLYYASSLDSLNFTEHVHTMYGTWIDWGKSLSLMDMVQWMKASMMVSHPCNGLILMFDSEQILDSWVIANPLTRKYQELPRPALEAAAADRDGEYGFGYDYAADDYKIVWIDRRGRTQIYSLRSDSWRTIGDCPNCADWEGFFLDHPIFTDRAGVFVNGALHWPTGEWIIALDVGTEDFRLLPLPPIPSTVAPPGLNLRTFGGGRLFCFHQSIRRYDGWVMNGYGVDKSWTMLFSIEVPIFDAILPNLIRNFDFWPVAYFERKKSLLLLVEIGLCLVDTESGSAEEVTVNGVPSFSYARLCTESLFPLGGTD